MQSLPALPCYLNGEFTYLPDAKISVMDRGFTFGDGVYEVVPVYRGKAFLFDRHMDRLASSLAETHIDQPHSREEWRFITNQLIESYICYEKGNQAAANQLVYFQVTRGVTLRDNTLVRGLRPTVFAISSPMKLPNARHASEGVACVSAIEFRWSKVHIQSTSLLGSLFARQIGVEAGAVETIMFRDGFLSEAAASDVWIVKDGLVIGTPNHQLVLEGSRFSLVEEFCDILSIPWELRQMSKAEVLAADEIILSSSSTGLLAVSSLDHRQVGNGGPGPVFRKLHAAYQRAIH